MVLPDKAELREIGTGSLLSQPGPPGPTGTGQETKRLQGQVFGGKVTWIDGGVQRGSCGVTGCKLAEEMASGRPGMRFGEEGMCPHEGGTLRMGVSVSRQSPERKSYELSSAREWAWDTVARYTNHFQISAR